MIISTEQYHNFLYTIMIERMKRQNNKRICARSGRKPRFHKWGYGKQPLKYRILTLLGWCGVIIK